MKICQFVLQSVRMRIRDADRNADSDRFPGSGASISRIQDPGSRIQVLGVELLGKPIFGFLPKI